MEPPQDAEIETKGQVSKEARRMKATKIALRLVWRLATHTAGRKDRLGLGSRLRKGVRIRHKVR